MKNKQMKAAVFSPRLAGLRNVAVGILGGLALTAALVCIFAGRQTDAVPNQAMKSVVLIDVEVERDANPFLFFFGRTFSDALDVGRGSWGGTPAAKEIVHYGGTGFFVNGHLITARHVVVADEGEKVLKITLTTEDNVESQAKVKRSDKASDLAELITGLKLPTLHLAKTITRGELVTELGNPGLIRFVISHGTIVGFDRDQGYNIAAIDTFGGNSGGPVINDSSEVVGMCHTLLSGSRFTGIGTLDALRDFLYPDLIR